MTSARTCAKKVRPENTKIIMQRTQDRRIPKTIMIVAFEGRRSRIDLGIDGKMLSKGCKPIARDLELETGDGQGR